MIIKHLEQKNQTYRNIKFNGLSVKALLNGAGTSGSTSVDFTKSTIQVILTRGGKTTVIVTNNLKVIGLASTIDTLNQSAFSSTHSIGEQLVTGQTALISFTIPFGGVIDLHGDDEIYIEVQNSEGLFTSNALEAASFLEIKPLKCYGVERFIPRIRAYVIQAAESNNQYMLGDNLIRLAILNFDKTDFKTNVINNVIFSSDRLDETYTYPDLIANKLTSYGKQLLSSVDADVATTLQQDQSFLLTDFHQEFRTVNLDIQFNGSNVTSSNNYIVAWNYDTTVEIIQAAAASDDKHRNETVQHIVANTTKGK